MGNYSELLKDPRWQKKRLQVLERDEWTCQYCLGTDKTLHVHHNNYEGEFPWDCPDYYLITLCEKCHKEEEDMKQIDLFSFVDGIGITRFHIVLLLESVRFRMAKSDMKPFWAFQDVLRLIIPNDELGELIKFRRKEKVEGFIHA